VSIPVCDQHVHLHVPVTMSAAMANGIIERGRQAGTLAVCDCGYWRLTEAECARFAPYGGGRVVWAFS
jgi:hypothetical protein